MSTIRWAQVDCDPTKFTHARSFAATDNDDDDDQSRSPSPSPSPSPSAAGRARALQKCRQTRWHFRPIVSSRTSGGERMPSSIRLFRAVNSFRPGPRSSCSARDSIDCRWWWWTRASAMESGRETASLCPALVREHSGALTKWKQPRLRPMRARN